MHDLITGVKLSSCIVSFVAGYLVMLHSYQNGENCYSI